MLQLVKVEHVSDSMTLQPFLLDYYFLKCWRAVSHTLKRHIVTLREPLPSGNDITLKLLINTCHHTNGEWNYFLPLLCNCLQRIFLKKSLSFYIV